MATYLARYCPSFSEVTAPLRQLLGQNVEFRWDVRHTEALNRLKQLLTTAPVLGYFSPTEDVVLQCDSSSFACSAVMLQNGRVIEYASRALTEAEKGYAQIEKELNSVQFAFERFHTYVYGRHVQVQTDHKPLLSIHKKALGAAPKRLQRMLLRLQRYNFDLCFVNGRDLVLADTLSRAVARDSTNLTQDEELASLDEQTESDLRMIATPQTISELRAAARDDEAYQLLRRQLAVGWPLSQADIASELKPYGTFADELALSGDFVFKGNRIVIPRSYRQTILDKLHDTHIGVNSCIRRARDICFWPNMTREIRDCISTCSVCVRMQNEQQKEPLMSHDAPSRVWEKVGLDLFHFRGQDYCIIVDYLSNYFEIDRLQSKKISDVIYVLKQQFARHGIPSITFSDNAFVSDEFRKFANAYDFEHQTSSPRYPQSNGKVEML